MAYYGSRNHPSLSSCAAVLLSSLFLKVTLHVKEFLSKRIRNVQIIHVGQLHFQSIKSLESIGVSRLPSISVSPNLSPSRAGVYVCASHADDICSRFALPPIACRTTVVTRASSIVQPWRDPAHPVGVWPTMIGPRAAASPALPAARSNRRRNKRPRSQPTIDLTSTPRSSQDRPDQSRSNNPSPQRPLSRSVKSTPTRTPRSYFNASTMVTGMGQLTAHPHIPKRRQLGSSGTRQVRQPNQRPSIEVKRTRPKTMKRKSSGGTCPCIWPACSATHLSGW